MALFLPTAPVWHFPHFWSLIIKHVFSSNFFYPVHFRFPLCRIESVQLSFVGWLSDSRCSRPRCSQFRSIDEFWNSVIWLGFLKYRRPSLFAFIVQVNLVIRGLFICEFACSLTKYWFKCQNSSQNASFYLRIQYLRSKIAGRIYSE